MSDDKERLLTCDEIAKVLSVKKATIRKWTRLAMIPALRLNERTVRFDRSEVLSFFKNRSEK